MQLYFKIQWNRNPICKKVTKYSMSHTSPSMQNTNGLRLKFRSRTPGMNLFQGRFYFRNNFHSVSMTPPVSLLSSLLLPFASFSQTLQFTGAAEVREKAATRFCFLHSGRVIAISLVVQQVQPRKIQRGEWKILGYFSHKVEVRNGIKRKAYWIRKH